MKHIIIVEDDPIQLKILENVLRYENYDFSLYAHPSTLLDSLITIECDLFLLDIELPDINGIVLCERIRQIDKFQNTPVIAITAGTIRRAGMDLFDEVIEKPVPVKELLKLIRDYLKRNTDIDHY